MITTTRLGKTFCAGIGGLLIAASAAVADNHSNKNIVETADAAGRDVLDVVLADVELEIPAGLGGELEERLTAVQVVADAPAQIAPDDHAVEGRPDDRLLELAMDDVEESPEVF